MFTESHSGTPRCDLDRLAPLFATPGWDPAWHRGLGEVYAAVHPALIAPLSTDERLAEPEPDEERLREIMEIMQAGRFDEPRTTAQRILTRLREIGL